jgi:hypothetical protein
MGVCCVDNVKLGLTDAVEKDLLRKPRNYGNPNIIVLKNTKVMKTRHGYVYIYRSIGLYI